MKEVNSTDRGVKISVGVVAEFFFTNFPNRGRGSKDLNPTPSPALYINTQLAITNFYLAEMSNNERNLSEDQILEFQVIRLESSMNKKKI